MDKAEVIQVVRTSLLRRGKGVESDPVRIVEQFWSLDGDLLAENDIWEQQNNGYQRGATTYRPDEDGVA